MNSESDFSYSFSLGSADKRQRESELIALDKLNEFPLPGNQVLARNPRNGRQMVLPAEVATALSYCTNFRTLDEHVEFLLEDGPDQPGRAAAITQVVKSVQEAGLFLSARDLCDRLSPAGEHTAPIGKPVVAIITWERPEALARLLDSLLTNCDPSGIERCIVVDDSRNSSVAEKNRAITGQANQRADLLIEYFGAAEALAFMNQLIQALPRHEKEIRFLLDREAWTDYWTAGIARNFCQLLSVGKPLIVCDDDSICDVYEAPLAEQGVEFSESTREAVFYRDRQAWPERAAENERDPFARHMRALGLTIPQALAAIGIGKPRQESFQSASAGFAGRLSGQCRVLTTECASIGDPGTANNQWVATLPPQSGKSLSEDRQLLESALTTRNCYLGRMRPAFVPGSNMSQITGSDNRDFLPPYFPIMRGQDQVFGDTCQFLFPDAVALDMPWAAPHLPVEQRAWQDRDNDFTRPVNFPRDLTRPPRNLDEVCLSTRLKDRLDCLARYYLDLAGCQHEKLLDAWIDDWHRSWSEHLGLLDEQLQSTPHATAEWSAYLQNAYRQAQASSLGVTGISGLESTELKLRGAELVSFWQRTWKGFGQSLLAWHEIREAAGPLQRN